MPKYLIQDIIPKERKHTSVGVHKVNVRGASSGSIDHQPHTPRRIDPDMPMHEREMPRRRIHETERPAAHSQREIEERDRDDEVLGETQNPREMIVNLVDEDSAEETKGVTTKYFDESVPADFAPTRKRTQDTYVGGGGEGDAGAFFKNWMPWFFGLLFVGVLVIILLNYFGGATVDVSPKKHSVPMDITLDTEKNPVKTELAFSVMKITLEETREVPATGEKTLTVKAKGQIIIYNTQSTTQRLIKNTRFQSPTGKIYRINDSVNIPKATVKAGKTTPGSLEVTVYADEAGPDYNTAATDFTLPGLKGSATFEKVYARGKGAIAGGASGIIKSVSDLDMKNASDELRVQLETKLRTKARGDLAPSQLSFDSGMIIELNDTVLAKTAASSEDKAVVVKSGTLYMVTFDRQALSSAIVEKLVQEYKGETVTISNIDALEVAIPQMTGEELWGKDRLSISFKGMPNLEWSINEAEIKKALLGAPKESFNTIMVQFPTVELAKATISPVWKRSFPKDEADIDIKINPTKSEP